MCKFGKSSFIFIFPVALVLGGLTAGREAAAGWAEDEDLGGGGPGRAAERDPRGISRRRRRLGPVRGRGGARRAARRLAFSPERRNRESDDGQGGVQGPRDGLVGDVALARGARGVVPSLRPRHRIDHEAGRGGHRGGRAAQGDYTRQASRKADPCAQGEDADARAVAQLDGDRADPRRRIQSREAEHDRGGAGGEPSDPVRVFRLAGASVVAEGARQAWMARRTAVQPRARAHGPLRALRRRGQRPARPRQGDRGGWQGSGDVVRSRQRVPGQGGNRPGDQRVRDGRSTATAPGLLPQPRRRAVRAGRDGGGGAAVHHGPPAQSPARVASVLLR